MRAQGDPDLYDQYHEGFRRQAADWPQQPVDLAIAWLKASLLPLPAQRQLHASFQCSSHAYPHHGANLPVTRADK